MEIQLNFPLFSIVLCLLSSVVSSVLGEKAARRISLGLMGAVWLMNAALFAHNLTMESSVSYLMGHFPAPWGNEIRMGILEPLLCMVLGGVMLLSVLAGKKYLNRDVIEAKRNLYYVMIDLIQAAVLALVYTNDVFTGYVFVEICTIASCGILMIRQIGRTTAAAIRYMTFSLMGSSMFLLGLTMLYNLTGHLLMPQMRETMLAVWQAGQYRVPQMVAICLVVSGLAVKSGLFPFHFWMSDTYGCATPPSAAILSGVISKAYIILLLKMVINAIGTAVFYESGVQNILFVFGVLGMIFGSLSAIRQNDVKRMVAFSSAAQIGYIYMGIGLSAELGILASVFHIIGHSINKSAAFLASAGLEEVSESRHFRDLQGAGLRNPAAGLLFSMAALSMVGVPGFSGFVSKLLFAQAAVVETHLKVLPALLALALSTLLNTIYFLRTVLRIYVPRRKNPIAAHMGWLEQPAFSAAAICFLAVQFLLGLNPSLLSGLLSRGLSMLAG